MITTISDLINKNHQKRVRIAVFGDAVIDEYYKVKVKRISPESPVPVMLSEHDQPSYVIPGGAGNAAAQLKHWNVDCTLFSLMSSTDEAVYERCGITLPKYLGLDAPLSARVPRKRRFQDGQNLIRWDVEEPEYGEEMAANLDMLRLCFEHYLRDEGGFDAVIFADYDKGTFKDSKKTQDLINLCRTYGVPTIVDPKDEPIEKWIGCTYFKPNSTEAEKFTGSHNDRNQALKLYERLKSNIVITRGGQGVSFVNGDYGTIESNKEVVVRNFSGAGDCFAAFFALAIAHKFSFPHAIDLAYAAGRIYVQREHNKPLIPLDLYDNKFVHEQDLKNRDFKLVVTNGCYDLTIHAGHISTFEFAKTKGDKLVVLINSDESIKKIKGEERPIIPLEQRMKMVAALECVDYVLPFHETSPVNTIKQIAPDAIVKGEDWKEKGIRGAEYVKEVYFAPLVPGISTTNLIKKIKGGS